MKKGKNSVKNNN